MKAKKILFVIEQYDDSRYYYQLFENLVKHQTYEFAILNLNYSKDFKNSISRLGINVKQLNIQNGYLAKLRIILKAIEETKPDIIHAHEIIPSFYASIFKLLRRNVTFVYHRHHENSQGLYSWFQSLLATFLSNKIVVVSGAMKAKAEKEFGFLRKEIKVIFNGISSKGNSEVSKVFHSGINSFDLKIGMLARFRPQKNHLLALKTLVELQNKEINACLVLAGEGANKEEIERLSLEMGIYDRVFFLGKVDDIVGFFETIDIHLIPSKFEPFGLVAIESMENKKLNIVSNVGGLKEIIDHGETGFIFDLEKENELIENVIYAINNPDIVDKLVKQAYEVYQEKFSPKSLSASYLNLYLTLN